MNTPRLQSNIYGRKTHTKKKQVFRGPTTTPDHGTDDDDNDDDGDD